MGLDMYMYLRKYEARGSYDKTKVLNYPTELKELQDDIYERNFLSVSSSYQVGYWRKFNALHNYIVKKFADNKDECQQIYLNDDNVREILDICENVSANHDLASELLPTCSGFFFGGTEYDDWYFKDVEYTITLLKKILNIIDKNEDYDVIYEASW